MAARNIQLRTEIEPKGEAWANASPSDRRAFWTRAGELALTIKRDEIRRGIGYDGKPLEPVLPKSRPDGAKGKPLDPHYAQSRTYRLLAMRVGDNGVTLFWHSGHGRRQKLPWATILGYHADGVVIGAPMRDVVSSISPAGMRKLKAKCLDWWKAFVAKRKHKPTTAPKGKPKSAPKPAEPEYREFDPSDADGMHAWTMAGFGEWAKGLTKSEREAIDSYSSGGYTRVNGLLRGTWWMRPEARPAFRRRIKRIDSAIDKGTIPENVVVWRGASAKRLGVDDPSQLAAGSIIEEKAYTSTSLSRAVAEGETFSKGVVFKIKVPKGSKAASIEAAVGFSKEREILLPRGGGVRVTKVTKTDSGHLIEGDWIPDREAAEPPKPKPAPKPESPPRAKPPVMPPVAARPTIGQPRADLSTKATAKGQPRKSPAPRVKAPAVVYLKGNQKPKRPSRSIQVYEEP